MDDVILVDDDLPDCWIKKQSKSRPNQFYYFNTATKKSQWTVPVSPGDKLRKNSGRKESTESPKRNGKSDVNRFKISESSKQIKKRDSTTPAQDRLQKVRSRYVAEQLKNAQPTQNGSKKSISMIVNVSGNLHWRVKPKATIDVNKTKAVSVRHSKTSHNKPDQAFTLCEPNRSYKSETNVVKSTDEIPSLFPSRTPGQERLNRLRRNESKPNESAQEALNVIRTEFGLPEGKQSSDNNNQNTSTAMDEDEPMDWEPCDIFDEVENGIVNEFVKPYIIPDTNVLLDELSCIRDSIHKDTKYNVLVPFVVLQELDRLKSRQCDARIPNLASSAIRFIYNELKSKNQRLQGQKATEDCVHIIDVLNADDKILNCCLQVMRQPRESILITNDINLCNKAMASGITAMTSKEYKTKQ